MLRSNVRIAGCTTAGKCVGSGNSRFGNDLQAVAETEAGSTNAGQCSVPSRHERQSFNEVVKNLTLWEAPETCVSLANCYFASHRLGEHGHLGALKLIGCGSERRSPQLLM